MREQPRWHAAYIYYFVYHRIDRERIILLQDNLENFCRHHLIGPKRGLIN